MPKTRETCTECSIRRQRCDKRTPCDRCIKRGVPERCTRHWENHHHSPRDGSGTTVAASSEAMRLNVSDEVADTEVGESSNVSGAENQITTLDFMNLPPSSNQPRNENHDKDARSAVPQFGMQQIDDQQQNIAMLQLLIPKISLMWKLINFHEKKLLWYHGCYHGPTFNSQVNQRIQLQNASGEDVLQIAQHDLQWTALLFAVLAGSMTSAGQELTSQWGFPATESLQLCSRWYLAATTALNLGNYMSDHNILGAQAIATLTMSAHTLGLSGDIHVHLGCAIRIAQALNLHRIKDDDPVIDTNSSEATRQSVLKKETGRRLWSQLCIQDWFSIPLAETHSIHRGHFLTRKPSNRDHLNMTLLDDAVPTYVSYSNYLYDIAALIAEMHNKIAFLNTDYTRYQLVMEYDARMRQLATSGRPHYFDVTVPVEKDWPWFIPWARRSLTISFAHKAMMIHRAFLKRSFTNTAFSFTRRTCIAASKTILKEARPKRKVEEPIIWIDNAFCIAAAITLALDACHRQHDEPEFQVHRNLVEESIEDLKEQPNSTLALRGVHLLQILLQKSVHDVDTDVGQSANADTNTTLRNSTSAAPILTAIHHAGVNRRTMNEGQNFASGPRTHMQSADQIDQENEERTFDELFAELLPPQSGFSNAYLFEELLDMDLDR